MELRIVPDADELNRPSNVEVGNEDLDAIYRRTMRLWNLQYRPTLHCPAGKPVLLERKHLAGLQKNYVVSRKADGVRYMLLLHRVDEARIACLWSLGGRAFEITVIAPDEFFDGTVLDGELVWEHSPRRMVFEAFDMVALKGVSYTDHAYSDRMRRVSEVLLDPDTIPDVQRESLAMFASGNEADVQFLQEPPMMTTAPGGNCNDLILRIKPFHPVASARTLWAECSDNVDGLIFTPNVRGGIGRVPINTARHTYKWKPFSSIDLLFDPATPSILRALGESTESVALDASQFEADYDNMLFQVLTEPCVVECRCGLLDDGRVRLVPMRHRNDKEYPNTMTTVQSTVASLPDAIRIDEF